MTAPAPAMANAVTVGCLAGVVTRCLPGAQACWPGERLTLVVNEFDQARAHVRQLRVGDADAPLVEWPEFKRLQPGPPDIRSDRVWEAVYEELLAPARAQRARKLRRPYGRHISIDRKRARPYDGHGDNTASDPFSRP
jgi:hypothetical protein